MSAFHLEKYNGQATRYSCPQCGHKRTFSRYVDVDGNYLGDEYGRCNRESKCGYHRKPEGVEVTKPLSPTPAKPLVYFPIEVMQATQKHYHDNTFVAHLERLFPRDVVYQLIDSYKLGTTRNGSCIFWQLDGLGVRTGKVIRYNTDGHRDKNIPPYFLHTKLSIDATQCLFGLHLISDGKTIGLVESEKTAVIMAGKLPAYTWMATGGKMNLSRVDALKGHKVVAFPDSDAFDEWSNRLSAYGFKISGALQRYLTEDEKRSGFDLADIVTAQPTAPEYDLAGNLIGRLGYPMTWETTIAA